MQKRRYSNNKNYISEVVGKNLATFPNDIIYMIDYLEATDGIVKFDRVREQIIQCFGVEDKSLMLKVCTSNVEKIMKTINKLYIGCDCTSCNKVESNVCLVHCFRDRYEDEDKNSSSL